MDEDDKIRRNLVVFSAVVIWSVLVGANFKFPISTTLFGIEGTGNLSTMEIWLTILAIHLYLCLRFLLRPAKDQGTRLNWLTMVRDDFNKAYNEEAMAALSRCFGSPGDTTPREIQYPFAYRQLRRAFREDTPRADQAPVEFHNTMRFILSQPTNIRLTTALNRLGTSVWTLRVRAFGPKVESVGHQLELRFFPWRALPMLLTKSFWKCTVYSEDGMERFLPGLLACGAAIAIGYKIVRVAICA